MLHKINSKGEKKEEVTNQPNKMKKERGVSEVSTSDVRRVTFSRFCGYFILVILLPFQQDRQDIKQGRIGYIHRHMMMLCGYG